MTAYPSIRSLDFARLAEDYGTIDFAFCLSQFIVRFNHPAICPAQLNRLSANFQLCFNTVAVSHKEKFWESDFPLYRRASDKYDVVHARPARKDTRQRTIPGQFDTVLVNMGNGRQLGIEGM
jgi:hypothetical protein